MIGPAPGCLDLEAGVDQPLHGDFSRGLRIRDRHRKVVAIEQVSEYVLGIPAKPRCIARIRASWAAFLTIELILAPLAGTTSKPASSRRRMMIRAAASGSTIVTGKSADDGRYRGSRYR
jgi:hypothetical protein